MIKEPLLEVVIFLLSQKDSSSVELVIGNWFFYFFLLDRFDTSS